MTIVTVSSKGEIVLPQELRDQLGIHEGDSIAIRREGDELHLRRLRGAESPPAEWQAWRGVLAGLEALREHLQEHRGEAAERDDIEDLLAYEDRRDEPVLSFDDVVEDLKRRGRI